MTANDQDVLLALLSLDAYNRGTNRKLANADEGELSRAIGTATWNFVSDRLDGATSVGFSASSYTLANQTTVIAYRGTDFDFSSPSAVLELFKDVGAGWMSSFGATGTDVLGVGLQPFFAQEFFELVTGHNVFSGDDISNVIVTGHSLGGGLAGYIGSLSGVNTVIFNEIPYLGLALTSAINEFLGPFTNPTNMAAAGDAILRILNGETVPSTEFDLPDATNISSFRTTGEIATLARLLGPFFGFLAQDFLPEGLSQSQAIAAAALIYGNTADAQQAVQYLNSYGGLRSPIDLHSQALMVMLTFAESEMFTDWQQIGIPLLDSLFDSEVAEAVGTDQLGGYGSGAAKMMDVIAYSVLDEGQLVFGNTGIRALFDDANELGIIATSDKMSEALEDAVPGLTQAIVQFAGLMAYRGIDFREYQVDGQPFDPLEGVIALSDIDGNLTDDVSSAVILKLEVNQDLWKLGANASAADVEILGLGTLVEDLLDQASSDLDGDTMKRAMQKLYSGTDPTFSVTKAIGSVEFNLAQGPINLTLPELPSGFDATHTALYVAGDASDTIHGSSQNNMIAGSDGDDVIYGRLGRDLLLGGDGSDLFVDSVTERSETDGRQNEGDVYIGSSQYTGLMTNFLQWLLNGDETDVVRYTVDNLTPDNPLTPEDESALQQEGVRVTDIAVTRELGDSEAIRLTVTDLASGSTGTDHLIGIEKVELSDRADEILVTDNALEAAILIDMGKSGRIESELPEGEVLAPGAFMTKVDVADYSGLTHGINYLNGVTSDRQQISSLEGMFQWAGWGRELLTVADYAAKGALGHNDALQIVGADRIKLTSHDDVLINAERGSVIETGAGDDKIWLSDGVAITDLSNDDRITLAGIITLYGGMRNSVSEDPRAWGAYGTSYGLNDSGELVISNAFWRVTCIDKNGVPQSKAAEMYVQNWAATYGAGTSWATGAGNISLIEYTITSSRLLDLTGDEKGTVSFVGAGLFELLGYYMKTITGEASFGNTDPLVLDLDGDGVELTSLDHSKARFDTDNDLYAEATGFVAKDDGILVRDINGDGKINSAAEMFGGGGVTGFGSLSVLDGNADGLIDASDNGLADFDGDGDVDANDRFDRLMVWQDRNENHATDLGELKSVSEWGIASIAIPGQSQATSSQVVAGNSIDRVSSYTLSDGTVRTVADVSFKVENQNTTYVGQPIAISNSLLDLANLKGYGTLVSLHEAMSLRSASEAAVRTALDNLSSNDLTTLRDEIKPILRAWAEGSPLKVNGQITTGVVSQNTYQDLVVVKDASGKVVDYVWGFSESGQAFGTFANETGPGARFAFASGVIVSVGGAYGADIDERTDISALIGSLAEDGSVTVTTGSTVDATGTTVGYLQYASPDGYVRIYHYGSSSWSSSLSSAADHSLPAGFGFSDTAAEDFAFYERLIGESLQPFFVEPDSASGGYNAVTEFLSKMEGTLNLFAVRLAVQSGPLSHHFDSIVYDAGKDQFHSADGRQLSDVFDSVLNDAETNGNAVVHLQTWKPFFDVFLADYSRGSSAKQVTYSFLVQNMLHAVEQAAGGVTIEQFAGAFGIPPDVIVSGSGELAGTSDIDILVIDGGETTVSGGAGVDNYIIGKNFGPVTIYDNDGTLGADLDVIRFSSHRAEDIDATRDGIDLVLTDKGTGYSIRITNQFEGRWPGPGIGDASFDYGVNQIIFADGTLWNKVDIAEQVSKIDDASTTIIGTADIDVLQGGGGDDILKGAGDTDVYRYGRGDGKDTIEDLEDNGFRNDLDMLQFLDGIRASDLIFVRQGDSDDLTIRFKNAAYDEVKIEGQFSATYTGVFGTWYQNRIELFTFDNGTSLLSDQVADLVLSHYSTDGNDQLYGMNREDVLRAGKGDDYISGGNQSDIYIFSRGDGHDVIEDNMSNILSGTSDRLVFSSDIHAADIVLRRDPENYNSIVLVIAGTQDSVTLNNQYDYAATGVFGNVFFDRIETVEFTDGSEITWSWLDMAAWVLQQATTNGDDTIYGFGINDVLTGGAGNDFLSGGNGDDIYLFGSGFGQDIIYERNLGALSGGDADKVVFQGEVLPDGVTVTRNGTLYDLVITLTSTGDTLTLRSQTDYNSINYRPDQVDEFHFSDGTIWSASDLRRQHLLQARTEGDDTIAGFFSNDTLDGGVGDDILRGGDGSDIYLFGFGYGNDVIEEVLGNVLYPDDDAVHFLEGVAANQVTFSRVNDTDLLVSLIGSTDTLLIKQEFALNVWDMTDIEEFVFADGTVISKADIMLEFLTGTDFNDVISGFEYDDTITGGVGNDVMVGGGGNDTFIYRRGDGDDTISDGYYNGKSDRLVFTDINPAHVTLTRNGNDVTIVIAESAPGANDGGSILLRDELNIDIWDTTGVERIEFADGTVWKNTDLAAMLLTSTSGNDTIIGFVTDDAIDGGAGGDTIDGASGDDTITGGTGNDVIVGGGGNDTFVYRRGDGHDTITDGQWGGSNDRLVFVDLNPAQVTLIRSGNDVTLVIAESAPGAGDAGSILIKATLDDFAERGLEKIIFADGTIWTRSNLQIMLLNQVMTAGNDIITGFNVADIINAGAGNDTINAGDGADSITGGLGNDVIDGGKGNDTYYYSRGDGNDTITESVWSGADDKLVLTNINPADVTLVRNGNDVTLVIAESAPGAGDAGSILIKATLDDYAETGLEKIIFADGTVWTRAAIRSMLVNYAGTQGNDTIAGSNVADIINAGAGNDTVNAGGGTDSITGGLGNDVIDGGNGNDTYYYSRGDGNDTITDGTSSGADDKLVLVDINPSDVTLVRNGNDVTIVIAESTPGAGDAGSILIKATLDDYAETGLEKIVFADGTVWTRSNLQLMLLDQVMTAGNDIINGFNVADIINAGAGNDTINAGDGADSITGGLGNDVIDGGKGNDTYYYSRGDGNDTITDGTSRGADDKLVLVDINPSDVTLVRNGNDVTIVIAESTPGAGDAGSILIKATLDDYAETGLEKIVFADGTVWTRSNLQLMLLDQVMTAGDDIINGFNVADIINAGAGNDTINAGDGADSITGGLGNDVIDGGKGNDTYYYSRGDGNDTITDGTSRGADDKLVLVDINPSDVTLVRNGNDVTIVIAESTPGAGDAGSILIKATLDDYAETGLEKIVFADGTVWTRSNLQLMLLDQVMTAGDDIINGFNVADIINAGAGNDTINAGDGADSITGGLGNDVIDGGNGNDTYYYSRGDGNDTITDGTSRGADDKLVLVDINPSDVTLVRNGNDVTIVIAESTPGAGDAGSILIKATLDDYAETGLEKIVFADGTIWSRSNMVMNVGYIGGTDGNDTINGTAGSDTEIRAGLGNDVLNGLAGSDTYVYRFGDGNDVITELTSGTDVDTLSFIDLNIADIRFERPSGNTSDVVIRVLQTGETVTLKNQFNQAGGVERITFADGTVIGGSDWSLDTYLQSKVVIHGTSGNDTLAGTNGNDIFVGGLGDDRVNSGAGSDTYIYTSGDGTDYIDDQSGSTTDIDVLKLTDLNSGDVTLSRSGSHVKITVNSTGHVITLDEQLYSATANWGIEQIQFANGTTWNRDQIKDAAWIRGTSGNDTLTGTSGNDTFTGGPGDDRYNSGAGSDMYVYASGDGSDYVDDQSGSTTDVDIVKFTDLNVGDLTFSRSGLHVTIKVHSTGHVITLDEQFYSATANWGIEQIQFADGTVWDRTQIQSAAWIRGTMGNDALVGTSSNDTLFGDAGNDTITTGAGNDIIVFKANFGIDTINDFQAGTGSLDVLEFDNSLFADFEDVLAAAAQVGNDTVITHDVGNSITLKNVMLANLHQDDVRFIA